jgi:hypothetical protein
MTLPVPSPPQQQVHSSDYPGRAVQSRSPPTIQPGSVIYPPYVLAPSSDPLDISSLKRGSVIRGHELIVEGIQAWNTLLKQVGANS